MSTFAHIQEIGRVQIGRKVLFLNFEAHHLRILVAARNVVYGNSQTLAMGVRPGHCCQQVDSKCGDAALARQVVSNKGDFPNGGCVFHP